MGGLVVPAYDKGSPYSGWRQQAPSGMAGDPSADRVGPLGGLGATGGVQQPQSVGGAAPVDRTTISPQATEGQQPACWSDNFFGGFGSPGAMIGGAAVGALIGSFLGPIGMLVGGLIGVFFGGSPNASGASGGAEVPAEAPQAQGANPVGSQPVAQSGAAGVQPRSGSRTPSDSSDTGQSRPEAVGQTENSTENPQPMDSESFGKLKEALQKDKEENKILDKEKKIAALLMQGILDDNQAKQLIADKLIDKDQLEAELLVIQGPPGGDEELVHGTEDEVVVPNAEKI